jgi:hypothetical protein
MPDPGENDADDEAPRTLNRQSGMATNDWLYKTNGWSRGVIHYHPGHLLAGQFRLEAFASQATEFDPKNRQRLLNRFLLGTSWSQSES